MLYVFDKEGQQVQTEKVNGVETGYLYFPKVSTFLFETQKLFLLEKVFDANSGSVKWSRPVVANPSDQIEFRWLGGEENDHQLIFLFNAPFIEEDQQFQIFRTQEKVESLQNSTAWDGNSFENNLPSVNNAIEREPVSADVAFTSEVEVIRKRELGIYRNGELQMVIKFHAESTEEDERLATWTNNLGLDIPPQDFFIFRETDVKEDLINWLTINNKRKEALLEGMQIKNFIGSYKGFINAIKFFGYDNLRVKEYWKNVNEDSENLGKKIQTEVIDSFDFVLDERAVDEIVPSRNFRKTNEFSLHYDITRATDVWIAQCAKKQIFAFQCADY